jgi:hypothetical protein
VDAYLHGAKLYAITYVDPFMQDKAIPNYPANVKVMDLIQSDPNVLEKASEQLRAIARKALENNLSQLNEEERMKIQNGSLILQQQVANNQLTNQQNNQAVRQSQSEVASPSSSGVPVSPQSQPQATTGNSTVVPKDEIVKPIDKDDEEAFKQKQREIFEQPLVK